MTKITHFEETDPVASPERTSVHVWHRYRGDNWMPGTIRHYS